MIEGQEGVSWEQWLALAQGCDRNGIPTLFRSDHYANLNGYAERGSLDAWGTLCALAAVTSKVRLGTMVSAATFRHPSVLAKLVTTADHVSNGRIELGIGAGFDKRENEAYGFEFPPARVRLSRLEEQIQILLGSWSEAPFSFEGAHYRLRELDAQPRPIQQPRPPLIVGGLGGPRSIALAARYADEYNTPFPTLAEARERRDAVLRACEPLEREPPSVSVMTGLLVGSNESDLRERAGRVANRIGSDVHSLLSDPPPPWIVGTIDQVLEQLIKLRDAGISRVMCQHVLHEDLDVLALIGEELAPEVA